MVHSKVAINCRGRVGWQAVPQDGSISPLQEDTKPPPKVAQHLPFLLPILPGKGGSQLLNLPFCQHMPPSKLLHHYGQEGYALPTAILCRSSHFPLVGEIEGVPRCCGSLCHCGSLEGCYHSDIQSSVSAPSPVGNKDICRPPVSSRDQEPALLDRS